MLNGKTFLGLIPARGGSKRFWDCVSKGDGCWVWRRGAGSHGYGQFYFEPGKPRLAHRVAWELENGPIPTGMQVLHKCDNKKCVRPDHLFIGTQLDNMRDMIAKGRRATNICLNPKNKKLFADDIADIQRRIVRGAKSNSVALAREYGVSVVLIRKYARMVGK